MNQDTEGTEFKWEIPQSPENNKVQDGDLRIVNLPVKVVFEWSDKIVDDYDSETDTILEYKSGYIMKVLPDQKFVFKGESSKFLASTVHETT